MEQIIQLEAPQVLQHVQALEARGERPAAIGLLQTWLTKHPNTPQSFMVWYEFGRVMQQSGLSERAEHAFRVVLEQKPGLPEASLALGTAMESQGKITEAVTVWGTAVQPDEMRVRLLNNIGRVFDGAFNFEPAEEVLIKSLRTNPDQPEVISTLLHLRARMCRWPVVTPELGVSEALQQACMGPLTSLSEFDDPAQVLESSRRFLAQKGYAALQNKLCKRGEFYKNHQRLRIGFLSADFRLHATSIFFVSILEQLDRGKFEVYALDITTAKTAFMDMRMRILRGVDHHVEIDKLDDESAARKIRECEIDVLVDIAGLTAGARPGVVARRPAPLQISYLGFLGSCGIDDVDYIVTTEDLFPKKEEGSYSEKPLYLPDTYLSMDDVEQNYPLPSRKACGLPEEGFIYCALLNPFKLRPEMFGRWMNILSQVPGSVLWLVEENATSKKNLIAEASKHGIAPERLVFAQRVMPQEYKARLQLADLFLDTSPYGNGATAHDALLANLPMLTKPGRTMMSRLTAHMMTKLGMKNFVVKDWKAYEDMAIELGRHPKRIQAEKARMKAARKESALFNRAKFVREFGGVLLDAVAEVKNNATTVRVKQSELI